MCWPFAWVPSDPALCLLTALRYYAENYSSQAPLPPDLGTAWIWEAGEKTEVGRRKRPCYLCLLFCFGQHLQEWLPPTRGSGCRPGGCPRFWLLPGGPILVANNVTPLSLQPWGVRHFLSCLCVQFPAFNSVCVNYSEWFLFSVGTPTHTANDRNLIQTSPEGGGKHCLGVGNRTAGRAAVQLRVRSTRIQDSPVLGSASLCRTASCPG